MFNRGQRGVVRVGVVLVFAAIGCGGTALEVGGDAGGGNAPPGSGSDPSKVKPSEPASGTTTGSAGSPGTYVSPDYGNAAGSPSYRDAPGDPGGFGPSYGGGIGPSYAGGGFGGIDDVGGVGGVSGVGGVTAQPDCSSPPSGQPLAPWAPQTLTDEPVGQLLADERAKLSGNWRGIVTTPFAAPFAIALTFRGDGSYSAHCAEHSDYDGSSPGCCRALYYGTDRDTPLKQWTLTTADADGSTSGDIDIIYDYVNFFGESGYQGQIRNLKFDAAGLRARFTFVYGDIVAGTYDLERMP